MSSLINVSLDLTKVDKSKLNKGKYLALTVSVNDDLDQFDNNVSCWESQSKEERESKVTRNFLGNGRVVWTNGTIQTAPKLKPKDDTVKGDPKQEKELPF